MLSPQQAREQYEPTRPSCKCGEPARLQISKKDNGNMNRWFWTCKRTGSKCDLFKWADGGPNMSHYPKPPPGVVNTARPSTVQTPPRTPAPRPHMQASSPARAQGSSTHQRPEFAGRPLTSPPTQRPLMASPHMHLSAQPTGRRMPASLSQQAVSPQTPAKWPNQRQEPYQRPVASSPRLLSNNSTDYSEAHTSERMPPASSARHAGAYSAGPLLEIHELPSNGEIGVTFKYDEDVKESLKQTFSAGAGRSWDPDRKMWKFPADMLEKVRTWAMRHYAESEIRLPGQESHVIQVVPPQQASEDEVEGKIGQWIDPAIWQKLYSFQREGVRFALRHHGRALIADDMGTGKTVQAICIAACYNVEWPLLIVCPSSVTITWLEALLTWLSPKVLPERHDIHVICSSKDVEKKLDFTRDPPKRHIVITSYDLAQKLRGYERHFGMIICDESHALKNRESQRTRFFQHLLIRKIAKRVLFLTGTPALSRPIELFTQIDMLRPGILGSYDDYGQMFCGNLVTMPGNRKEYKGAKNKETLNQVLTSHIMLRRLKKDVLEEIPPLQRSRISVLPDPKNLKAIEEVKQELRDLQQAGPGDLTDEQFEQKQQVLLMKWYRVTGPAKIEAGVKHIEGLLEQGRKLVVFAHHGVVLDGIEEAVRGMKHTTEGGQNRRVAHMRIDGSTSQRARSDLVKVFQSNDDCRVAILSIKAAGAGITLSAANTIVFLELWWNPGDLTQAEARAHRIGQEQEVQVQYLSCPGSADDMIWSIVNSKLQVVGSTLDGHTAGTAAGLRITSTDDLLSAKWKPPAKDTEDDTFEVLSTPDMRRDERTEPARSTPRRRSRSSSPAGERAQSPARALRRRLDFGEAPDQAADLAASQTSPNPAYLSTQHSSSNSPHGARQRGHGGPMRRMSAAQPSGTPGSWPAEGAASGVFQGQDDDDLDASLVSPEMDRLLSQRSATQAVPASSGIFQGQDDDDTDALLASPAMERLLSQPPNSQAAQSAVLLESSVGPGVRRSRQQAQPRSTGRSGPGPGQQQAQVSAWDYPKQPPAQRQRAPHKEVIDLTGED